MSFLISDAMAETGKAAANPGILDMWPLFALFGAFYFFIIRPQAKRAKEQKAMVAGVQKGDEIVSNGGVLGRISAINDSFITLEVADGVSIKIQRTAIHAVMPKGTIKTA